MTNKRNKQRIYPISMVLILAINYRRKQRTNLLKKSKSHNDKIQGMLDGRKQRIKDRYQEQIHSNNKNRDQDLNVKTYFTRPYTSQDKGT